MTGIPIAVSEWVLGDRETAIARAQLAGFDAIEINAGPESGWAAVREAMDAAGLVAPSLCWAWNTSDELGSPDPARRLAAQQYLGTALRQAEAFGAARVVVVPVCRAEPYSSEPNEAVLDRAASAIAEVLRDAPAAVGIAIEPLNRTESFVVRTLADGDALRLRVDDPRASILADVYHMHLEETSLLDALAEHIDQVGLVHFAAADRGVPRPDVIDFAALISMLSTYGYGGSITMECQHSTDATLAASLAYVRSLPA